MINLYTIVGQQFPQFVQHDYPVFINFVETYYKWLEEQSIGKLEDVVDIEKTTETFVQHFKSQLDVYGLFNTVSPFNPKYLTTIKQIYNAKGSEQGLVYLLRAAHKVNTTILYPSTQILKASDGRWSQDSFITVELISGAFPTDISEFYVTNNNTPQRVTVTRYLKLDEQTYRLYFNRRSNIITSLGSTVSFINHTDNTTSCYAEIVSSPFGITIRTGGADWLLGQIIVFPSNKDASGHDVGTSTIARVSKVDNGTIQRIEILKFGTGHKQGDTLIVSPYKYKPLSATTDIEYNPNTKLYTLTISDFTDSINESVTGYLAGVGGRSYFLEDYNNEMYNGDEVIRYQYTNSPDNQIVYDTGISIERWLASRATLEYKFNDVAHTVGMWSTDNGHISNENIRLQDNYYYQQFSYVIETPLESSQYQSLADAMHPAGMKRFTNFSVSTDISVEIDGMSSTPFDSVECYETIEPTDRISRFSTIKTLNDIVPISDMLSSNGIAYLSDSTTPTDVLGPISYTKVVTDGVGTSDSLTSKDSVLGLVDNITPNEQFSGFNVTIYPVPEMVTINEALLGNNNLSLADSVSLLESIEYITRKILTDSTVVIDSGLYNAVVFNLVDDVFVADTVISNTSKATVDSVTTSDVLSSTANINTTLADSIISDDGLLLNTTKILTDSTTTTDLSIQTDVSTIISLSDSTTVTDNIFGFTCIRGLDDSLTITDSYFLSTYKYLTGDGVTATSADNSTSSIYNSYSGSDIYFAEDYVPTEATLTTGV